MVNLIILTKVYVPKQKITVPRQRSTLMVQKIQTNVARGSLHFHNRAPAFLCLILANQNWFHKVVSVNGCHRILIYRSRLH